MEINNEEGNVTQERKQSNNMLNVRLPDDLIEIFERAEQQGYSKSDITKKALTHFFHKHWQPEQ